jgi:hypothetical protein
MKHEFDYEVIARYEARVAPGPNASLFAKSAALSSRLMVGNVAPSPKLRDELIETARKPRDFQDYRGEDRSEAALAIDIRAKRGRVFDVMSAIGLGSLVPYRTIETIDLSETED